MSHHEFTSKPTQSDYFSFGKTDHDYIRTNVEPVDEDRILTTHSQQFDDKSSSSAVSVDAAITKIKSELKLLCSLQVSTPNKSSTNSTQNNSQSSIPLNPSDLEFSYELFDESPLFEKLLSNSELLSQLDDNSIADFPFDEILSLESDMQFEEFTNMSTEQNIPPSSNEENYSSNDSVVDDSERDDRNRRGLKKSGGPVRKLARFGNRQVIKYSDEYHDRRQKNNEAVKKSRLKAKDKQKDTEIKMSQLAGENRSLNERVDSLLRELQVLKSLYKELNQEIPTTAVKALENVNVK